MLTDMIVSLPKNTAVMHEALIGKIAKLHSNAGLLARAYAIEFDIPDLSEATRDAYEMEALYMFSEEPPTINRGLTLYCLREIGDETWHGDYKWFTLDQLILCQ